MPDRKAGIHLARLPARLRQALRAFRRITGHQAVVALLPHGRGEISPPVHPECARFVRRLTDLPCQRQWRLHVRHGVQTQRCRRHTCSLGLRCVCVPVTFDARLVGLAKFVVAPQVSNREFLRAVEVLALLVAYACQQVYAQGMAAELEAMGRRLAELERTPNVPQAGGRPSRKPDAAVRAGEAPLVGRALDYLGEHYLEPDLSLAQVAKAVGSHDKYLAHLFSQAVGQRMHSYLEMLRVGRACELLLGTDRQIKQVGYDSGFAGPTQFSRTFHRLIGVSPGQYRRMYGAEE